MADIAIQWTADGAFGDWYFANGDLATATGIDELSSSVIISIFTDGVASPDYTPTNGTNDRRGWWANDPNLGLRTSALGSLLWLLFRSKIVGNQPLTQAKSTITTALQSFVTAGIAASVTVNTFWLPNRNDAMGITINMVEPTTNANHTFNYSWAWTN